MWWEKGSGVGISAFKGSPVYEYRGLIAMPCVQIDDVATQPIDYIGCKALG